MAYTEVAAPRDRAGRGYSATTAQPSSAIALRPLTSPQAGVRLVPVPVLNLSGEPVMLGIGVEIDDAGKIRSWWLHPPAAALKTTG